MGPPHDPLNPWEIARKQKKQKTSYIGGFFKKKDETQVREEREADDARAAAAQAEVDSCRLEAAHNTISWWRNGSCRRGLHWYVALESQDEP